MLVNDKHATRLSRVRAVSFDLDDTLWDCEPVIVHAEAALHRWFERNTPRIVAAHTNESILAHRMAYHDNYPDLQGDVTAMRKGSLELLFAEHGYDEALVDDAFSVFYQARSEVVLYDGVEEMLSVLGKRYQLAAITNGNADLEIIGISHHFHDVQRASLASPAKPDSAMFEACVAALELSPGTLLHVGDSPYTDVGGAQGAGALTVWYNQYNAVWPDTLPPPDFEVKSIQELTALLLSHPSDKEFVQ
ncbi:MAG: HAD family hydrolase [Granulosicoccus sp.]